MAQQGSGFYAIHFQEKSVQVTTSSGGNPPKQSVGFEGFRNITKTINITSTSTQPTQVGLRTLGVITKSIQITPSRIGLLGYNIETKSIQITPSKIGLLGYGIEMQSIKVSKNTNIPLQGYAITTRSLNIGSNTKLQTYGMKTRTLAIGSNISIRTYKSTQKSINISPAKKRIKKRRLLTFSILCNETCFIQDLIFER
ncbi:MAG: hypothetical protein [aquatic viral metagenome]